MNATNLGIKPNADVYAADPMKKADLPTVGRDAMLAASLLAADVMAETLNGSKPWNGFCVRLRQMSTDGRKAYLEMISKSLKAMRSNNAAVMGTADKTGKVDVSKEDKKLAGVLVSSATNYLSQLNGIAKAWNNTANDEGLVTYVKQRNKVLPNTTINSDDIGMALCYEYAKLHLPKSAGPKAQGWAYKVNKWLETNKPDENSSVLEVQAYTAMTELAIKLLNADGEAAPF
jgi:hypothetical protein